MEKKKFIIICSYLEGTIQNALDFAGCSNEKFSVICADGGFDLAMKEGISPDLVVGDFDSIKAKDVAVICPNAEIIQVPSKKDITDTGLAVELAIEKGAEEILIIGGMGGRVDHTIAIIQTLGHYTNKDIDIKLGNKNNLVYMTSQSSFELANTKGEYFSLFAFSESIDMVTIKNSKYPLNNYTLKNNFPIGISNEFLNGPAFVKKGPGQMLVIISKD